MGRGRQGGKVRTDGEEERAAAEHGGGRVDVFVQDCVVERHDRRPVFRFFLLEDLRARRHSLVASSTAHAAMERSVVT